MNFNQFLKVFECFSLVKCIEIFPKALSFCPSAGALRATAARAPWLSGHPLRRRGRRTLRRKPCNDEDFKAFMKTNSFQSN